METLYRKEQILNIVDRCFHMYASDYRNDARIYATEMLEEITKPIKSDQTQIEKLEADKAELLEALEIFFPMFTELDSEFGIENPHPRKWTETEIATVQKLFDLLQKHKQ